MSQIAKSVLLYPSVYKRRWGVVYRSTVEKSSAANRIASKDVVATFQGSTLVLKGTVATAHDRDLAGVIARMEPGVAQVQNDLVVLSSETPE